MLEIDGSYGEGGGALLRTALALSTLTNKPFKIKNIRSGRQRPGLKAQHLCGIKALKEITGSKTPKIELGVTEIWFQPGKIKSGDYTFDIGTAGSITLFLQTILLPCLFAPGKISITIKGGTCGKWQASVDYLQHILIPHLNKFVKNITVKILKRGYFPKGGGVINVEISPMFKLNKHKDYIGLLEEINSKVKNIDLSKQGELEQFKGIINMSLELTENNFDGRVINSLKNLLRPFNVPVNISSEIRQTQSIGGELLIWSRHSNNQKEIDVNNPIHLSGDALITKNSSPNDVAKEAVEEMVKELSSFGAVDKFLCDQLLQFVGLKEGSKIVASEITMHSKTNMFIIEKFLPIRFKVEGDNITILKK